MRRGGGGEVDEVGVRTLGLRKRAGRWGGGGRFKR